MLVLLSLLGAGFILYAYIRLLVNPMYSKNWHYHMNNLIGGLLIALSMMFDGINWGSMLLQIFFMAVAVWGIEKYHK